MEKDWLNRTEMLIGAKNLDKLKNANVVVFGLGGVGSYVVEGLVRAGIGNIAIIDKDIVDIIIDGGYGDNEESTVVDCTDNEIVIIRQGKGILD